MMTIREMKESKRRLGYSSEELSRLSGVPLGTLQKIMSGATASPRRATLLKLEKVLARTDSRPGAKLPDAEFIAHSVPIFGLREEPEAYYHSGDFVRTEDGFRLGFKPGYHTDHRSGEYTLEDYLALPDEVRVELIDGVFYYMAGPGSGHQAISGFLHKMLLDHVLKKGGECMPLMSPLDVRLDADDKTVVQPDVMVICDRKKFNDSGRVFGAPEFVAEVLSPSTRRKDLTLKLYKYANAGVREYWIIDPTRKMVITYDLEHDAPPVIYGENDKIPVGIWGGECLIDMGFIWEHVGFLYKS